MLKRVDVPSRSVQYNRVMLDSSAAGMPVVFVGAGRISSRSSSFVGLSCFALFVVRGEFEGGSMRGGGVALVAASSSPTAEAGDVPLILHIEGLPRRMTRSGVVNFLSDVSINEGDVYIPYTVKCVHPGVRCSLSCSANHPMTNPQGTRLRLREHFFSVEMRMYSSTTARTWQEHSLTMEKRLVMDGV